MRNITLQDIFCKVRNLFTLKKTEFFCLSSIQTIICTIFVNITFFMKVLTPKKIITIKLDILCRVGLAIFENIYKNEK